MIPLTDSEFNNLKWENVEGPEIDRLISGLAVIGAEPIDSPLTDGAILYLKGAGDAITVLEIGADLDADPKKVNPFYIKAAGVKW